MNLYEQQAFNRRRTVMVMVLFVCFLLFLGLGFDVFIINEGGPVIPIGTLLATGLGFGSAVASFYGGDRAVLGSTHAMALDELLAGNLVDEQRLKYTQLDNVVDEMAIAAGLPKPKVYIVPDDDPNAFATGRDPEHASLAVTRGLLDVLNREQLQGVVGHEMSHIRNYDIRVMTVVAALVGAIALLADWTGRSLRWGAIGGGRRDSRERKGGGAGIILLVIWLIAIMIAPLAARLLALMVSRQREYLADASSAELTRNPGALADALYKIEFAAEPTKSITQGTAHLCIADPLGRAVTLKEGFWADLLATHPPMVKRIAALRQMAYQHAPAQ
jgi:heat shock protein HtpX